MSQLTAAVASGTKIFTCDVVKFDGHYWLIPQWWDAYEEGYATPARAVRLTELQHQKTMGQEYDFVVNTPIPTGVLDGTTPPQECAGLVVLDNPDVRFQVGHS